MNFITINTDASLCPETKIGGYAFWIKSSYFTIKKSGYFNENCINSTDAEIKCIANAIATLSIQKLLDQEFILIINTDSLGAISWMKKPKNEVSLMVLKLLNEFQYKNKRCSKIKYKHVKGHSNVDDARSFVNKWCDKEAGKQMRKRRKELSKIK